MDDLAAVGDYFERKRALWTSSEGSVAAHLRHAGRNGLVAEFRSDPDFVAVSRYLYRMVDVQYVHDTALSDFKARVQESILGTAHLGRGAQRQVSLIIRAALLASGVSPLGERLERIAGALPRG
jgi:hypothetical protein